MASSDDDFPITTTTAGNHHSNPNFHHTLSASTAAAAHLLHPINTPLPRPEHESNGYDGAYCSRQMAVTPYETDSDQNRSEFSDGGTPYSYSNKKSKVSVTSSGGGGGEYRKDREEWSDDAIACLLDVYLDKFLVLNTGNLRGTHPQQVVAVVSEWCEKQRKSVDQCKNKVDNWKKEIQVGKTQVDDEQQWECREWEFDESLAFKKMEQIVGNALPLKTVLGEENSGSGGMSSPGRQSKRQGFDYSCVLGGNKWQVDVVICQWIGNAFQILQPSKDLEELLGLLAFSTSITMVQS